MRLCQPSLQKRDELPHDRVDSFALRISALPHFCGKSPVCLPSTVYKAGSTTWRRRTGNLYLVRHAKRRTIVDARRSICRGRCKQALRPNRCYGFRASRVAASPVISEQPWRGGSTTGDGAEPMRPSWRRRGPPSSSNADFAPPPSKEELFRKAPHFEEDLARHQQPPVDATSERSAACKCVAPPAALRARPGCCPRGLPGRVRSPSLLRPVSDADSVRLFCPFFLPTKCARMHPSFRTVRIGRQRPAWPVRQETALDSAPRSQNRFSSSLTADDFELLRPHLRTADLSQDMVLVEVDETLKRAYLRTRASSRWSSNSRAASTSRSR